MNEQSIAKILEDYINRYSFFAGGTIKSTTLHRNQIVIVVDTGDGEQIMNEQGIVATTYKYG
jgi:hypothetical protein